MTKKILLAILLTALSLSPLPVFADTGCSPCDSASTSMEKPEETSPKPWSWKDISILAGTAVALLTWVGSQILIPYWKDHVERKRAKTFIITIIQGHDRPNPGGFWSRYQTPPGAFKKP